MEMQFVTQLVLERAGVVLDDDKRDFVETRVRDCARKFNFESGQILVEHLKSSHYSRLHRQLIEELVDDDTHFFRDFPVFKNMRHDLIPKLLERNKESKKLRIWCGACSSGQEAYSIAIMMKEAIPTLKDWDVKIIGSDMSKKLLEKAADATYSQAEVSRGMPAPLLLKHFHKDVTKWVINDDHKSIVEFRQINLNGKWDELPGKWDEKPIFDIIFLRNVITYFSRTVRESLLRKLPGHMHEDSYLILGKEEQPKDDAGLFEVSGEDKYSTYQLAPDRPVAAESTSTTAAESEQTAESAAPVAPDGEPDSKVLVTFRYKDLQSVMDMVFRDVDPDAHVFLGLKNKPLAAEQLFQVVNTVPDWAKKKDD